MKRERERGRVEERMEGRHEGGKFQKVGWKEGRREGGK